MTYPYVQAYTDLGLAQGPRLAMLWHMAEGGNTVAYLAKPNPNGVSVHFVVEYTGRVVQMLRLTHMHSSIRASDIRRTDDLYPDPPYGRSTALEVLGKWADTAASLGPNHATIAVEVEGFAKDGPNRKQVAAIAELAADVGLPAHLGHRDFADYKACPGRSFPWAEIGGHGIVAQDWKITDGRPGTFTCTAPGAGWIHPDTFAVKPMPVGTVVNAIAHAWIGGKWDMPGFLGSDATVHGRLVLAGDGAFVETPAPGDCSGPIAAATAPLEARLASIAHIATGDR